MRDPRKVTKRGVEYWRSVREMNRKPRREDPLAGYEVRSGKDGKVGIYTRDYNCRLATFNSNTHSLQQALKKLFDKAQMREKKRAAKERTETVVSRRHKGRDPLRNNPVVGFMSEAQAERILAEMRAESA